MNDDQAKFLREFCALFPFVAKIRDESVHDNGEVLPFLVMGDVTRQAISWHDEASVLASHQLREVCAFLEREFTRGSPAVQELIALGFLENLGGPPNPSWKIRESLGPRLRREIEAMWPSTTTG